VPDVQDGEGTCVTLGDAGKNEGIITTRLFH
jgi:hypothetical protein